MANKMKAFGGLNTRSNDIDRPETDASDLQNVELDSRGNLIKRNGSILDTASFGGKSLYNYLEENKVFGAKTSGFDIKGGTVSNPSSTVFDNSNPPSYTERIGSAYIANGINEILKFDGLSVYRAGCPTSDPSNIRSLSSIGGAAPAADFEVMVQFYFRDRYGNITLGDVDTQRSGLGIYAGNNAIFGLVTDQIGVTFYAPVNDYAGTGASAFKWSQNTGYVSAPPDYILAPDNNVYYALSSHTSTNSGTPEEDFQTDLKSGKWALYWKNEIGWNDKTAISSAIQSDVNTVNVNSGHGIEIGDQFYVEPPAAFQQQIAVARRSNIAVPEWTYWREVTNVTATSITFDGDSTDFVSGQIMTTGLLALIYVRETSGSNLWELVGERPVDGGSIVQTEIVTRDLGLEFLDQPTLIRETPPKGKYIHLFQDLLFIAGNDESPNTVFWSTEGESVETFNTGIFAIKVGDSLEGEIRGIGSFNDTLVILLERAVYFATGIFGTNQIRVWKVDGSEAGCSSHATVQNIEGELLYLGDKGVFSVSPGGRPVEIGWKINNLITDDTTGLNIASAVSAHDRIKQFYILHIPAALPVNSITLVFDYHYKIWIKHVGMDMSGGVVISNKELYFVDSTPDLQKEQSAFNDNGVAIDAYFDSDWESFGDPGVDKNFLNFRYYVLDTALAYTLKLKTYNDYNDSALHTDTSISVNGANGLMGRHKLHNIKAQAMKFRIQNDILNEGLFLTKYELEYDLIQKRMKK